ncbi:unnamed protein product [Arabidopsis lyrata]|nr:unnamed protein product [Arabidopsis lyrata]
MPSRPKEIMSNPDCRPAQLCLRVTYLIRFVGDLDTAAKYARLAVFTSIKSEATAATCQAIIGGMLQNKRHDDAYDLYDFFFNHFKLRPNSHCCNYIIESRFKQGLVDEALGFHNRSIESGMVHDYPSQDTFRVLTKWLVHAGRMDQAEALLRDRTVGRTTYPDHVAYKNLIRGFLDLGDLDKADLVLAEFKRLFSIALSETKDDSNYENRVAFLMATFMEYWFKQGKEVEAMECYNLCVIANKLPVCTETGNALLKVLLKYDECFDMGRFSEAWETYNKASAKNHFLSDRYNITKCCRHGSQSFFFAVFSANHLITRFCQNGMLSEAQLVFYDSLEDDLGYIDVNIFKTLIDAFVKDGFPDDAIKISNKMIDSTLKEVSHLV